MLSAREKEGIRDILEKLDNHSLMSLSGTITKGMIKAETKDEAITIILMYSQNAYSLLCRRKIKKEILFHYLKDNNVALPATADKAYLVLECLKLWVSDVDYDNVCEMEDVEDEETSYTSEEAPSYNDNLTCAPVSSRQQTTAVIGQQPLESPHVICNLDTMGQEFATWFYRLLNNVNTEPTAFHSNHFWPDCIMHLQMSGTNMQLQLLGVKNVLVHNGFSSEQVLGSQNVTDKLIRLIVTGQLFFHPNNLQNGVSAVMERHGLVKILVSGVLHQGNHCVGLFDQSFGLVRNAYSDDNWKIKYVELLLKLKHTYLMIA